MTNPYDEDDPRHELYKRGFKLGVEDRHNGNGAAASRQWSQAYRYGYSDGYSKGTRRAH